MINLSLKNLRRFWVVQSVAVCMLANLLAQAQDTLPTDPATAEKGKGLFTNNCASCHAVTADKVIGPGLQGIEKRRNEAWLIKWVQNPAAMVASGDEYAVKLYGEYKPTMMTAFTSLSPDDVKAILAYVKASEVVAKAPVTTTGSNGNAKGDDNSGVLNTILIALLVVMALILVALFAIVNMLSKVVNPAEVPKSGNGIGEFIEKLASNEAFRNGALLLFMLLAGKATIDGMYRVGIHQGYAPKQPIAFSHKLHAGDYQINCNYCHTGVYKGKGANIPSANICMNCHNAIKRDSPEIQKIYRAAEQNQPIEWIRVHNLPDLAYFNHSQHTNVAGLECKNCHGDIEKMEVVQQRSSLTMGWCIDCHRKTDVNAKGNAYYDRLMAAHKDKTGKNVMKVENIGGLECSKCHY